jgi:CRISPR/Cas system CMR subunit Cmr6 (Cas7 group RAMP superfamily)
MEYFLEKSIVKKRGKVGVPPQKLSEEEKRERKRQCDRKYLEENREKKKEYLKNYYNEKKENIILKLKEREKILCNCCNNYYYESDMKRHLATKKHIIREMECSNKSLVVCFD